jgi:hypothetical protein
MRGKKTGGRVKGTKNKLTLDREAELEMVRQLVLNELGPIVQAQLAHCKGIDHFFLRNPKTKQFEQVTDPQMIQAALNIGDRGSYYWIFTKDPSVQAFTALMDRTFGKPQERVELTGRDGGPLIVRWEE